MDDTDKVLAGVFTLAIVAVLMANNSTTSRAVAQFGSLLANLIKTVMEPAVTANAANNGSQSPLQMGLALVAKGDQLAQNGANLAGNN